MQIYRKITCVCAAWISGASKPMLLTLCAAFAVALSPLPDATAAPQDLQPALNAFDNQEFDKALAPLQKAASQGSVEAQYRLGMMYRFAWGVEKDFVQARKYFEQAAAQEHAEAQAELGKIHKDGRGTKRDLALAAKWFERAARNSEGIAQLTLARMYEKGRGVPKDFALAWTWYSMAISNQYMDAMGRRNQLQDEMSEQQIEEAKARLATLKAEMGIKK